MNVLFNITKANLENYIWGGGLDTWRSLTDKQKDNAWASILAMGRDCNEEGRIIMISEINAYLWWDYYDADSEEDYDGDSETTEEL